MYESILLNFMAISLFIYCTYIENAQLRLVRVYRMHCIESIYIVCVFHGNNSLNEDSLENPAFMMSVSAGSFPERDWFSAQVMDLSLAS